MATYTEFGVLSELVPEDEGSWQGRVFLTFDIDWAHDEIIRDSVELVRCAQVAATWFVTHNTPLLTALQEDNRFEVGIHPNFNPLLDAGLNTTSSAVIANCMSMLPRARSVRSHSLTQNERMIDQFRNAGLTHISNIFIPCGSGIQCRPFHLWDRMIMVPHSWQDNVALKMDVGFPSRADFSTSLQVLDFHPIHVFLNSESLDRYERTRPLHQNPKELIKHRFEGYGTRNRLLELLALAGHT